MRTELPIALSNKHIHLSQADIDKLFGEGYELTRMKDLSQPGQFACEEKVEIVGAKGNIKMRVLGPIRPETQVEIFAGDAFKLGVPVIIKDSGDLAGTPGCKIAGPKGEIEIPRGVMVASRHIHMNEEEAKEFGVKDKDIVKVRVDGPRALVFENVLVRASNKFALEMHVDMEEGNACCCKNGQTVQMIK